MMNATLNEVVTFDTTGGNHDDLDELVRSRCEYWRGVVQDFAFSSDNQPDIAVLVESVMKKMREVTVCHEGTEGPFSIANQRGRVVACTTSVVGGTCWNTPNCPTQNTCKGSPCVGEF